MRRYGGVILLGTLLATHSGCVFDFVLDQGDGGVIYVDRNCWDCAGGYYDEFVYTPDHYRDVWIDEVWFEEYFVEEWYFDEWYADSGYDDGWYDDGWYDDGWYDDDWYDDGYYDDYW